MSPIRINIDMGMLKVVTFCSTIGFFVERGWFGLATFFACTTLFLVLLGIHYHLMNISSAMREYIERKKNK